MSDFDSYFRMIHGKTLTNIFFTKQDGPHDYRPGIHPAYYFSTIIEVDHAIKFRLGNDFLVEWHDEEPTFMLTRENWHLRDNVFFKGEKIVDLTQDDDLQLSIHLENGTTIAHTVDYGDQLFIENKSIIRPNE